MVLVDRWILLTKKYWLLLLFLFYFNDCLIVVIVWFRVGKGRIYWRQPFVCVRFGRQALINQPDCCQMNVYYRTTSQWATADDDVVALRLIAESGSMPNERTNQLTNKLSARDQSGKRH